MNASGWKIAWYSCAVLVPLLLGACATDPLGAAPGDVPGPEIVLRVHDPVRSEVATGRILVTAFENERGENWVLLLAGDGRPEWSYRGPDDLRSIRARPGRDGRSVVVMVDDVLGDDAGAILRFPLDGGEPITTPALRAHHDFVERGDGFAYLEHVYARLPLPELEGDQPVVSDGIRLVDEGAVDEGEARFDFFADYPIEPWWTCPHMALGTWVPGWHEWTHGNSLVEHPTDDAFLVLPRYLDAIVKVDAASGEVLWQLGGRDSDFTFGPGAAFVHGHFSHAFDDRILVFDNGDSHADDPPASRVVELVIDEEARTAEVVWEHVEPRGRHVGFLGDARRLRGGNTLVSWGQHRRISEVTPDGDVVWEVALPGLAVGRVTFWPREGA
jgi:hypothetical protein